MQLGQTIIKIRQENKLTQEDFAKEFNVTRQTVSNWENEKSYPDLLTLVKISDMFGYSLDSMLRENPDMTETMNRNMKHGESSALLGGISAILLFIITVNNIILNYGSKYTWILFFFVILINAGNINITRMWLKKEDRKTKLLLLLLCLVFTLVSFGITYYLR